jgi:hypothetical protein
VALGRRRNSEGQEFVAGAETGAHVDGVESRSAAPPGQRDLGAAAVAAKSAIMSQSSCDVAETKAPLAQMKAGQ